jgi:parallel beta-helix repeat protein
MKQVPSPHQYFTDKNGKALDAGQIFIGAVNQNPETSQIPVYWDEFGLQPAAQPIRTYMGYIVNGVTRSRVYVGVDDFSMMIKDKNGVVIDSTTSVESSSTFYQDLSNSADPSKGAALIGYKGRTVASRLNDLVNVRDFGATGDGVTDDAPAIQAAFDTIKASGGELWFPKPAVKYRIASPIGTNQMSVSDTANNVTLSFDSGTEIYFDPPSAPAFGSGAINLEGNNVRITSGLILNSSKTIDWQADPGPQRVVYYAGIVIGGKGNRRLTPVVGHAKSGALVEGVIVRNFNAPITAYGASDVRITGNTVEDCTDTGILIDNCISNIEVDSNVVRRSFDDCFFARHYRTSPWVVAGTYFIGDVRIHHNRFVDTFAKSAGAGGYSDVLIESNYCANTWYCAINLEVEGTTWADNTKRCRIVNNTIVDAARNFQPGIAALPGAYKSPVADTTQQSGIVVTTSSTSYPDNTFKVVDISGNIIVNPGWHGISVRNAFNLTIAGNTCIPGRTTRLGVNYDTGGESVRLEDVVRCSVAGNTFDGDGVYAWVRNYSIAGSLSQKIVVTGNTEQYTSAIWIISDSTVELTQVRYTGENIKYTKAWNPGAIADGVSVSTTVTATIARLGDYIYPAFNQDLKGLQLNAYVSSSGVVTFTLLNNTGAPQTISAGTVSAVMNRVP